MNQVLVVEDDADIREALVEGLREVGFDVVEAANGQEALDRLGQQPSPGAILLDLHMPVLDGYGVLRAMARDLEWRAIPVFLTTAAIEKQLPLGVELSGVFRKPYAFEQIVQSLHQALGTP